MSWNNPQSKGISLPFMKRAETDPNAPLRNNELRLPGVGFLPNRVRNHFIAAVGEFMGTFLFLFFAFAGTQIANGGAAAAENAGADLKLAQAPNAPVLLYIALAFGFSLAVNVWVFFRISGGLFNPAVTLGLAMIGAITWTRAAVVFVAEMIAGMCAAGIVSALFPGPLNVTTALNRTTSLSRGLFIEMFLTFELILTIFMLAAEKHKGTFLAPVGIGLALFVAELAGVYYTGGSLNPARSFGPCVANRQFPVEHWIYWLGPILGSILAVGFYRFIKMLEYETANPGADFNEKEDEAFKFDEDTARGSDIVRPTESQADIERMGSQLSARGNSLGSPPPSAGRMSASHATGGAPRIGDEPFRNGPVAESGDLHELHPGYQRPTGGA